MCLPSRIARRAWTIPPAHARSPPPPPPHPATRSSTPRHRRTASPQCAPRSSRPAGRPPALGPGTGRRSPRPPAPAWSAPGTGTSIRTCLRRSARPAQACPSPHASAATDTGSCPSSIQVIPPALTLDDQAATRGLQPIVRLPEPRVGLAGGHAQTKTHVGLVGRPRANKNSRGVGGAATR